jgi:hypothetical protein
MLASLFRPSRSSAAEGAARRRTEGPFAEGRLTFHGRLEFLQIIGAQDVTHRQQQF